MKLNIIASKTLIDSFNGLLRNVKSNFFNEKNIIIVPDKFSLNAENMLFDALNIGASFNVEVLSFSKLANIVLSEKLQNLNIINKQISILIISEIIDENKDKLLYFKNIDNIMGIYSDLFNLIAQMQSSNFSSDKIKIEKDKFKDVKLIYSLYLEKLAETNIDASKKFELLINEIENSSYIKNANIHFGYFYTLTPQMQKIVKNLVKHAKTCNFACISNTKTENNRVFVNSVFENLMDISKSLNIKAEINNVENKSKFNFLLDNMFAYNRNRASFRKDDLKLVECLTIDNEVRNCLSEIKYDILSKNIRFNDIAILTTDSTTYFPILKKHFKNFNFPYFLDTDSKLSETSVGKFILNVLNLITNFNIQNLLLVLKSEFIREDENLKREFERFIFKYNIKDNNLIINQNQFLKDGLYESYNVIFQNVLAKLYDYSLKCENYKNTREFFDGFNKLLKNFNISETIKEKIEFYSNNNDILKVKQYLQLENKILEVFENIEKYLQTSFSLKKVCYFVDILFSSLAVSTPPISVDSIFVGDIYNSYFKNYKNLYILGASNSLMPLVQTDKGLVADDEIEKLKLNLEPKISDINKLNFFKCFIGLFNAEEKIYLSYAMSGAGGKVNFKSNLIKEIERLTDIKTIKGESENYQFIEDKNDTLKLLALANNHAKDFEREFYLNESESYKRLLKEILLHLNFVLSEKEIDDFNEEFALSNLSISKIEEYSLCPRKFFYNNIMKLREPENLSLNAQTVGNIVHLVANILTSKMIKNEFNESEFKKCALDVINEVLNRPEYKFLFLHEENFILIDFLKIEILKFALDFFNQQEKSNFKTKFTEYKFNANLKDFAFKGTVDRIDVFEDGFIIVDYKTGSTKFNLSDIYIGKKVQLVLYAYFIEKLLNKKCKGIYYYPIKDNYLSNEEKDKPKLKNKSITFNGFTVNSDNAIYNLDNEVQVEKSGYVSEFFDFSSNNLITKKEFENLVNFVVEFTENATKKIMAKSFKESPLAVSENYAPCNYCAYAYICAKKEIRIINESLNKKSMLDIIKSGEKDGEVTAN